MEIEYIKMWKNAMTVLLFLINGLKENLIEEKQINSNTVKITYGITHLKDLAQKKKTKNHKHQNILNTLLMNQKTYNKTPL